MLEVIALLYGLWALVTFFTWLHDTIFGRGSDES